MCAMPAATGKGSRRSAGTPRARWTRNAAYYRTASGRIVLGVVLSIAQSVLVVPIALLVKTAFDRAIPARDSAQLLSIGAGILLLYVGGTGITLFTRRLFLDTTKSAIATLRVDLVDCVYALSAAFHRDTAAASLHSVIVQDTERLDNASNVVLAQLVPAAAISAALCLWLAWLNPWLLIATLSVLPLMLVINRALGPRVREGIAHSNRRFAQFSQDTLRMLEALDLARLQTAEASERARQAAAVDDLRVTSSRIVWLASAYTVLQNTVTTVSGVVILVAGGTAVLRGSMSLGDLASFYVGVGLLTTQAAGLFSAVPHVLAGDASLEELWRLLDTHAPEPYGGTTPIEFDGRMSLDAVTFGYGERVVLSNASLTVEPHQICALVGPNGSGKTSIVNLLLGWYRPQRGSVSASHLPLDTVDVHQLRRQVGVVPQDPILLDGTIRDNLTYGMRDVSDETLDAVCEQASALSVVRGCPAGYDTGIGAQGAKLSGGQRQRLAIARALLRRPTLLVLDEPTNHLDADAVAALIRTLRSLPNRPTVLLITHDLNLAAQADATWVVANGTIERQPALAHHA